MIKTQELEAFRSLFANGLKILGLDVDVFVDYVTGILEAIPTQVDACKDEVEDEIAQEIKGALALSLEDPTDERLQELDTLCHECSRCWVRQVVPAAGAALKKQQQEKLEAVLNNSAPERGAELEAAEAVRTPSGARNQLFHERLVSQYGFDVDEILESDEEGRLHLQSKKQRTPDEGAPEVWYNDNRERIKKAQQAARAQAKVEHEMDVRRIKTQHLQNHIKQEKEKQRVAKKERKSGR